MSKHNRERRQERKTTFVVRSESAPELSDETMERVRALNAIPGQVNHVGIFHEQFCADALRRGSKKCMCKPDVRFT